jgi:FtsH-binding integral membrane protein
MIMGGKRGKFAVDDYIMASLNLYIDIIQMFIYIVRLLSKSVEDDKKKK